MRTSLLTWLVAAYPLIGAAQQIPTAAPAVAPAQNTVKSITLSGCIQGAPGTDQFTLSDTTDAKPGDPIYKLTGKNVRAYIGHRVRIVGGLVPSPNVAAQAGALDPAQSAIAGAAGSVAGSGRAPTLEIRLKSVKPLAGPCKPPDAR